ncbi:MAG: serine/threonine protein kinase, partial [Victivallales bacterium]|nr:serine/threonine protein kinase [Victivallales bacterium]
MFDDNDQTIKDDANQQKAAVSDDSDRTLRDSVPAPRRLKTGDVILGQYEVLGELGQGGMGVVYRCFDRLGRIEVALKSLPPELAHDADEIDAVQYNFSLVAKLVHQNIAACRTLVLDKATGACYLVMEYVQGETLKSYLRKHGGKLLLEEALPILRQVAEALDFAHQEKVMHRDIKPGNIMLCPNGKVKVLDFGLAAQIRSSMSRMSQAYSGNSGTRQYKAPEQWRGRPQGTATDQYALAVTAYEMLSGNVPFDDDDASVLREMVLKEQPLPIYGLPDAVNNALARGLAKEPSERFANCCDFARALEEGARKEETTALRRNGGEEQQQTVEAEPVQEESVEKEEKPQEKPKQSL